MEDFECENCGLYMSLRDGICEMCRNRTGNAYRSPGPVVLAAMFVGAAVILIGLWLAAGAGK